MFAQCLHRKHDQCFRALPHLFGRRGAEPSLESVIVMIQRLSINKRMVRLSACFVALLSLGIADSAAMAEGGNSKQRKDARTCESFGAKYDTPAFSDCMLTQQRRRDTKQLRSLEEVQMVSQIAKDGQIMSERARRQRCDRKPERRECGR
jgi:hypothetical protein